MPVFNKCCCCIKLQIGILILGYLNLLSHVTRFGKTLQAALDLSDFVKLIKEYEHEYDANMTMSSKEIESYLTVFIYSCMVYEIIMITIVILLLVGTHNKRKYFILPYLIVESIFVALHFILLLIFIVVWIMTQAPIFGVFTFFFIIACALGLYFLLCVVSWFQEIQENERHPPRDPLLMQPMGVGQKPYPQQNF